MTFILVLRSTFEPMLFVLVHYAGLVELLFMFTDQCLYVNKSLN